MFLHSVITHNLLRTQGLYSKSICKNVIFSLILHLINQKTNNACPCIWNRAIFMLMKKIMEAPTALELKVDGQRSRVCDGSVAEKKKAVHLVTMPGLNPQGDVDIKQAPGWVLAGIRKRIFGLFFNNRNDALTTGGTDGNQRTS